MDGILEPGNPDRATLGERPLSDFAKKGLNISVGRNAVRPLFADLSRMSRFWHGGAVQTFIDVRELEPTRDQDYCDFARFSGNQAVPTSPVRISGVSN